MDPSRRVVRPVSLIVPLALALTCLARATHAQSGQGQWISLDGSPPDLPPNPIVDVQASSPQHTVFDLVIHGFWLTPRQGDDGRTYQQISVPGMMTLMQFGAPELPVYRFALGLVTSASSVAVGTTDILAQSTYPNVLPWPHVIGAIPDIVPHPEQFVRDDLAYRQLSNYPGSDAQTFEGVDPGSGGLRVGVCEVHPFQWNATGVLTVNAHTTFVLDHPGTPRPVEVGSAMSAAAAMAGVANNAVISPYLTWDHLIHHGYFLFVVPSAYEAALTPLIEQKKKRGFLVTVIHKEDIPAPGPGVAACKPTRDAIAAWYAGTPHGADHYCILAGNYSSIPPCYAPRPSGYVLGTQLTTDDYFGDADGNGFDDEGQEVYVGRLPGNDASEMATAVAHILAYEDSPSPSEEFDHAGLIAWNSNDDDRFQKAMNVVAAASYASVTPTFDIVNGGLLAVNNTWIDGVAQSDGIVAYNGHGGPEEWFNWDRSGQSYTNASVNALVNHPVLPVIWSLACNTANILDNDCFGKRWLTHGVDGAASFYGATELSWIYDNGIMVRRLFDAVFNHDFTIQGVAIAFEEFGTVIETSTDNPVQYLLLGDPEMHIRRTNVSGPAYVVQVPPYLVAGPVPPLDITVRDPNGRPVGGVKVALWKRAPGPTPHASAQTAGDEVLDNRYSDANGNAHFDLPTLTSGTLYVTTLDDIANAVRDSVPVAASLAVGGGGASRFLVAGSIARGAVSFLLPDRVPEGARLVVFDVSGRAVRALRVVPGQRSIAWDGADSRGARARPALYLARLEGAGSTPAVRFVLLD